MYNYGIVKYILEIFSKFNACLFQSWDMMFFFEKNVGFLIKKMYFWKKDIYWMKKKFCKYSSYLPQIIFLFSQSHNVDAIILRRIPNYFSYFIVLVTSLQCYQTRQIFCWNYNHLFSAISLSIYIHFHY